jgi:polyhydroxyalkanoate synthesis regulator protein
LRHQLAEIWGADPFKAMQEQTERNMTMFHDAMRMFNPFTAAMANQQAPQHKPQGNAQSKEPQQTAAGKDDLQALKDQLSAMQRKIDAIADGK